jgi:hypothetical protein
VKASTAAKSALKNIPVALAHVIQQTHASAILTVHHLRNATRAWVVAVPSEIISAVLKTVQANIKMGLVIVTS